MKEIFLHPGEYYVGHAGSRIRTVLGSCVSITLWHPALRIGAMSHSLLSSRGPGNPGALDARYAEEAMLLMLRDLANERVNPRDCRAKLFGGSRMFPEAAGSNLEHLGQRNVEAARLLVRAENIPIVAESLAGIGHRVLIFDISSGAVWLRRAKPLTGHTQGTR
jgi:chemotaxis protein CheD